MSKKIEWETEARERVKAKCKDCGRVFLVKALVTRTKYMMKSTATVAYRDLGWCRCGSYNVHKARKREAVGLQESLF